MASGKTGAVQLDILKVSQDMSHFDAVMRAYRALRRAGVSVDVVPPDAEAVRGRKLVLMPAVLNLNADVVTALRENQTVVLAGPLTGAKGQNLNIAEGMPPGALRSLIDIAIRRVESRRPSMPYVHKNGGAFTGWLEEAIVGPDVQVVEQLEDGRPALLRQGNVLYVPGLCDNTAMDRVVRFAISIAGVELYELPPDIRVRDNGDLRFVFNYGPRTASVADIFEGSQVLSGSLELASCDVTILRKRE